MTTDDSTTRVDTTSGADLGPGERLRQARESAQLTVAEVASRLRLEPRVIERLENDDYDRLHGPTFVRGYLSGYARLLDLPDGPILEAYERHGFGPPALVSELGRKPEVHVSDFPVRMVTYVIAGLLVVLVVLWWQSRQLDTATSERAEIGTTTDADSASGLPATTGGDETPASPSAPSTDAPQIESTANTADVPESAPAAAGIAPESSEPAPSVADAAAVDDQPAPVVTFATETAAVEEPAQSDTTTPETPVVVLSVDAGGDTTPPAPETTGGVDSGELDSETGAAMAVVDEDTGPASPDADDAAEAAPARRPTPLPGSDVLAIQLSRESWIEIYDRGGGRLYYSLAERGSEVVVRGAGPMRVLLGEVEGAEVAYNGEPYDLSRFEGRSVVRFTVGELSETTPETPAPAAEEPPTGEAQEPTAEARDESVTAAPDAVNVSVASPAAATPTVGSAPQVDSATETTESEPIVARPRPDS